LKRCYVTDNFLADPHEERTRALAAQYSAVEHRGLDYAGIAPAPDQAAEQRVRDVLGVSGGAFTTFWRRYLPSENPATFVHNDCQIGAFSGILFLSPPEHCKGGVAFWRHRLYGWEVQPAYGVVEQFGEKSDNAAFWDRIKDEGLEEARWEMVDYVPMQFNRMVLFDSKRYHSRYPKAIGGTSPGDCRLIKTFFWMPDPPLPGNLASATVICKGCGEAELGCLCRDEKRGA
jgi:hypothetical protein